MCQLSWHFSRNFEDVRDTSCHRYLAVRYICIMTKYKCRDLGIGITLNRLHFPGVLRDSCLAQSFATMVAVAVKSRCFICTQSLQLDIARPRTGRCITINFHRTVQKPISASHTDDEDRDTVCARLNQAIAARNRCTAPCSLKCDVFPRRIKKP